MLQVTKWKYEPQPTELMASEEGNTWAKQYLSKSDLSVVLALVQDTKWSPDVSVQAGHPTTFTLLLECDFLKPGLDISDFCGLSEHDRLSSFEMLGQNSRKDLKFKQHFTSGTYSRL